MDAKEIKKRKREKVAIVLITIFFIALTFAEFQLTKLSTTLPFVNSIFFFGLLNINIIVMLALVWLIFRNVGKVFLERRSGILGARLKTKLIVAFFAFSIIPTLVLFVISSLYINSSFDKWFSIKIQNTLQASLDITATYYRNTEQTAMHFADHLSQQIKKRFYQTTPDFEKTFPGDIPTPVRAYLNEQRELLALSAVEFYTHPLDQRFISEDFGKNNQNKITYPRLPLDLLDRAFQGEPVTIIQHVGSGDLIRCLSPIKASPGKAVGVVSVNSYIPVGLVNKADEIASVIDDYKETNPLKYPVKTAYFLILIMITLVIIFVAIWIGLYMAKELTVPVEKLVHGAQAVGAGNLDVHIESSGRDEIAVLIESFNKMTSDLKDNRARLTQTSADLERRRLQLEAVLANIGTGVMVVDKQGEITTFNRAAAQLLEMEPGQVRGKKYSEVLKGEAEPLVEIIEDALKSTTTQEAKVTQWNFRSKGKDFTKSLAGIATSLQDNAIHWGVVAVIDDMTHLIKGQREMAWREVARRIAHEIKNPLTPIKLSAQRLQRRLSHFRGRDGALLKECTDTIVKHTDELKEMVNEFSNFARFPETSLAPHQLNEVAKEVSSLFIQAHPQISFDVRLEPKLLQFEFDRDQIKRVIMNLLDNAVSAVLLNPPGKTKNIILETHYNDQLKMAVIIVKDNGPGIPDEVKTRIFEPYFSTKKEGTGLGLAITKRIVNDHDGFIRVHSAPDQGTEFLIELPTTLRHSMEGLRKES